MTVIIFALLLKNATDVHQQACSKINQKHDYAKEKCNKEFEDYTNFYMLGDDYEQLKEAHVDAAEFTCELCKNKWFWKIYTLFDHEMVCK